MTTQAGALHSIADVAQLLAVSQKVVRRHIAAGELPEMKVGSSYRITDESIVAFQIQQGKKRILRESTPTLFGDEDLFSSSVGQPVVWTDIHRLWSKPSTSDYTFVDLFSGAGGLSKGLELAGLQGICGLDFFKEAGDTYRRNFHHPFVFGDITQADVKAKFYQQVHQQLGGRHLHLVAGGFPCQGFSMAGNRLVDDPRNALYLELLEFVRTLQPDFVLCENVKGLRSMQRGAIEAKILSDFKSIGYEMSVATLSAADYYTPQRRERVIFIGNRRGLVNRHPAPLLLPSEYITTAAAIGDLMNHPEDPAFNHVPTRHSAEMQQRIIACPEGQSLYKGYSDAWKKSPWNEPSCTIKENHGGVNIHPRLPRVLTAREMARLQSFPDDFIFEGKKGKQLVQIGNAVPPLLGKAVGLAIRSSLDEIYNDNLSPAWSSLPGEAPRVCC